MSKVLKAVSDPTRRRVLELLRDGPQSAGDLARHFPFSKPTMSAHFAVLKEAGLVDAQKVGKQVIYRLRLSVLEDALLGLAQTFGVQMDAADARRDDTAPSAATKETSS
ncbi:MAG: metalloregulator ArsR/SmtB family transcription factor [Pseudomonadota bacterium]